MKKKNSFKLITLLIVVIGLVSCSDDENTSETSTSTNTNTGTTTGTTDYDITPILSKFEGTGLTVSTSGTTVTFNTQDLPNHKSPYWPTSHNLYEAYNGTNSNYNQNPNTISTQNITITVSLNPAEATNKTATNLGPIGVSRNGVVFFNQYAGPNNQPLTSEIDSFDQYLGHPQNTGQYHYHLEPAALTEEFGDDAFLGILADGFPVYGPLENGTTITNADLDEYHGHTSATADFPDGIYHYHVTPNEDPYINGNGYFGVAGSISQ